MRIMYCVDRFTKKKIGLYHSSKMALKYEDMVDIPNLSTSAVKEFQLKKNENKFYVHVQVHVTNMWHSMASFINKF